MPLILLFAWVAVISLLTLGVCFMITRATRQDRDAATRADVQTEAACLPASLHAPAPIAELGRRPRPVIEDVRDAAAG